MTGTSPPPSNPQKVKLAERAKNLRTAIGTESTAGNPNSGTGLLKYLSRYGCSMLNAGCFAAGTKLWTPLGYQNVEILREGDLLFARNEFDPSGPIEAKPIEQVFRRFTEIVHLHAGGQLLRTTQEHPFYVFDQGWTPVSDLHQGDWLLTANGDWQQVEEIYYTGELEVVYNLRVADHHTYFVGDSEWGWAIWAHNLYSSAIQVLLDRARHGNAAGSNIKNCVDLLEGPELTALIKGNSQRETVKKMTLTDFRTKLEKALRDDQFLVGSGNLSDDTARQVKNALEKFGTLEKAPATARPTSASVNPYGLQSQEAHHHVFKRDVLDGKGSIGGVSAKTLYEKIVSLLNATAVSVHVERLILQLPAGSVEDRNTGLKYHLERAKAYADANSLAEVEFRVGDGQKEVDLLLTDGTMVDLKAWSEAYCDAMTDADMKNLDKQVRKYLDAQPTRNLRLEFPVKIPAKVLDLIDEFNTKLVYTVYKNRLEAEVKPYA